MGSGFGVFYFYLFRYDIIYLFIFSNKYIWQFKVYIYLDIPIFDALIHEKLNTR